MHLLLSVAALAGIASAQTIPSTVKTQCFTRYSFQSTSDLETAYLATTTTQTATVSVTLTPLQTITPSALTSSVTTTLTIFETTTLPIVTDTYTTSVTERTTLTSTQVESYTQTVTTSSTTTLQSTTTISAPSGFTALAQEPGFAQKRNAVVQRREALQSRGQVHGFIPIISPADATSSHLVARAIVQSSKTTSVKAMSTACIASDPVLTAIKNDFGQPLNFCQWWAGASYTRSSPINGIAVADITRVCKCVKEAPGLIGTKTIAMAAATSVSKVPHLSVFQQLVAQPLIFCNFWFNAPTRSGSPFTALPAPSVSQVCKAITATPSLVATATSTASTSIKAGSISVLPTNGQQYPVAVSCTMTTTILPTITTTFTASTSTLIAATPTQMITFTSAFTSTITHVPADATKFVTISTDTITSTSTSTTSTTQTQTSTFTVEVASATLLAQCASSNIISSAVGQKIGSITFNKDFTLQSLQLSDTTGYGCCEQCALTENCAGYAQAPGGGYCYYITTDGRCAVDQSFGDRFNYYNTNGAGYQVGNGQCGFLGPVAGVPTSS